jgi:hypothetical protein
MLPALSLNGRWAGFSLGITLRFTSFSGEGAVFESILAFSGYVNFYNSEKLRVGLRIANFNDYTAGNFGAYYLTLNSMVSITKFVYLINDLEVRQTGSSGLSASFYGIAYRGGVIIKW